MKQSMLRQYRNKRIVISIFSFFLLCFCKKQEQLNNDPPTPTQSVKYISGREGVRLSKNHQNNVFGKWKLTNAVFFNDIDRTSVNINIDECVTVSEQGIFNLKNELIARKHNTIGTYQFNNLDTLNTVYYVFTVENDRMMMKTPSLFRVVNGKRTKQRARVNLFFKKQ